MQHVVSPQRSKGAPVSGLLFRRKHYSYFHSFTPTMKLEHSMAALFGYTNSVSGMVYVQLNFEENHYQPTPQLFHHFKRELLKLIETKGCTGE